MIHPQNIHIVGTGTISEPLIGLLLGLRYAWNLGEITFHKHTPRPSDRPRIAQLIRQGAGLAVDADKRPEFEKIGLQPTYTHQEALARAAVVIDCASDGVGRQHKTDWYQHLTGPQGFLAQGSEFGFGKMYAFGINDGALHPDADRFLHIVSCNTHNLSVLIHSLALHGEATDNLIEGHFVCMRRATDVSQEKGFTPAPEVGMHSDAQFGTHHARDAWHVFRTLGYDLNLFSSAIKLNTQFMHSLWFNLRVRRVVTRDDVVDKLRGNPYITVTEKTMTSPIFAFGRDHGYFGRLLNQTVVSLPSLAVRDDHEIVGFCFTPQDGNVLLSNLAATGWLMEPACYIQQMTVLTPYLFDEV